MQTSSRKTNGTDYEISKSLINNLKNKKFIMDRKIQKKNPHFKKLVIIGSSLLAAGLLIYFIFFYNFEKSLRVGKERLTIATVTNTKFVEYIPPIGEIIPIKTVYLDAVQGGQVEKKFLKAGAMVEKGDPIISLSNINLLLDIMHREAEVYQQSNNLRNTRLQMEQNQLDIKKQLTELKYNFKNQKRRYERYEVLYKKKLCSQKEWEEVRDHYQYLQEMLELTIIQNEKDSTFRQIQIKQLEKSLERMENNLKIARENLERLTIKAPVTGQLTSLNPEIGESISPGERIGQVDVLDGFKIRAEVDEHYIARINKGQNASFRFNSTDYQLKTIKVFPEVINGKFKVDLAFIGDTPAKIRRGQTIHLRLELGNAKEAIVIPTGGFYQNTGGQWIFVIDNENQTAYKRKIKIGRQNPKYYEILDGLKPSEQVVISNYDNFGDVEKLIIK